MRHSVIVATCHQRVAPRNAPICPTRERLWHATVRMNLRPMRKMVPVLAPPPAPFRLFSLALAFALCIQSCKFVYLAPVLTLVPIFSCGGSALRLHRC